jgi:hypothetical protein
LSESKPNEADLSKCASLLYSKGSSFEISSVYGLLSNPFYYLYL